MDGQTDATCFAKLHMVDKNVTLIFDVTLIVAVHLGVKMADTLSFTAKVDMVDF